ncbi:hypothetical protein HDG32_001101 [Paraburkholderia sp. CI2]|uniref:phasin family protein n=1 Tax=Paraburkholderia sp. CI2 TaxID=2723093 RepID=UPI001614E649|nr:phasin family protein [Paraburkholderia sp. CI2]MBB5465007.1 hypothetical protein [Paraburkholderia sp. CI2]
MDSTNPNSIFAEYTKVFGQFKLPGVDVGKILESRRKDIEALAEANTAAFVGVQSLARKQAEIMRAMFTELQSFGARLAASTSQPANAGEVVQQALHKELKTLLQPKK